MLASFWVVCRRTLVVPSKGCQTSDKVSLRNTYHYPAPLQCNYVHAPAGTHTLYLLNPSLARRAVQLAWRNRVAQWRSKMGRFAEVSLCSVK